MSPLAIQAQDDTLHRVQQGTASTRHRPRPRPRPRARPHRRPYPYPHPRPHPRLHLTAPPPPIFLQTSTAGLLTHLCTIKQTPERRPHAYPAQRVAPRRDGERRKASRGRSEAAARTALRRLTTGNGNGRDRSSSRAFSTDTTPCLKTQNRHLPQGPLSPMLANYRGSATSWPFVAASNCPHDPEHTAPALTYLFNHDYASANRTDDEDVATSNNFTERCRQPRRMLL